LSEQNILNQFVNNSQIKIADRFRQIDYYTDPKILQAKENYLKTEKQDTQKLIDLSLGSPDSRTPELILKELAIASKRTENHGYPMFSGKESLKIKIIAWLKKRFQLAELKEPKLENILPLMGSKEGLAHFPLSYLNPGDVSIVPDPHYPVHYRGAIIAGSEVFDLVLDQKNNYLPDLNAIPKKIANKARLLTICYPNNPTGAIIEKKQLTEIIDFCRKYNILLCHDLAYSEVSFLESKANSIFEIMSLEEPGIEFFTFSKTYHMAGWRLAFALGNKQIINNLLRAKTNLDYGVCNAIQSMGIAALELPEEYYLSLRNLYQERTAIFYQALKDLDFLAFEPKGGMYVWTKKPDHKNQKVLSHEDGTSFCKKLVENYGIVATPGKIFGKHSTDYIRFAMVQKTKDIKEAISRLQNF